MSEKQWKIDGEPVSFNEVIKRARAYGYESDCGIYQTSVATRWLRENGHTIEYGETKLEPIK